MLPLQVRSVPGVETLRKVRTRCGLFRESTHMVRKSGPRPYVLQEVTGWLRSPHSVAGQAIPVGSTAVTRSGLIAAELSQVEPCSP